MKKINVCKIVKLVPVVTSLMLLSLLTGCQKSDNPGANEVFIENFAFNPGTITVSVNTTITWTNKDRVNHTVTSTTGIFDSGSLNKNETFSYTFSTAGSYPYKCTIHPYMTGTVVVQ